MAHKLKVEVKEGVKKIEVDDVEIDTIKAISLRTIGASVECNLIRNDSVNSSFGASLVSEEGVIELDIPASLAAALKQE